MISNGDGRPPDRLVFSGLVQESVNALISEAYLLGIGPDVRSALKTIFHRLETEPLEFGELVSELKSLNLVMHAAEVRPVVVHFGINEQLKIVFVQKIFRV